MLNLCRPTDAVVVTFTSPNAYGTHRPVNSNRIGQSFYFFPSFFISKWNRNIKLYRIEESLRFDSNCLNCIQLPLNAVDTLVEHKKSIASICIFHVGIAETVGRQISSSAFILSLFLLCTANKTKSFFRVIFFFQIVICVWHKNRLQRESRIAEGDCAFQMILNCLPGTRFGMRVLLPFATQFTFVLINAWAFHILSEIEYRLCDVCMCDVFNFKSNSRSKHWN